MKIVLLGAPGSGKGSVGTPLSEELNIPVISTGEIFRDNIKNETKLGVLANKYIEKGNLVPDEITVAIVEDRINKRDCAKGYILDGFPRTVNQANEFEKILSKKGESLDLVINIKLEDKIIIKRLSNRRICSNCNEPYNLISKKPKVGGICDVCGSKIIQRADDSEETVKARLETYYEQTQPLVDYYEDKGLLESMNNDCSMEEGFQRAMKIVNKHKGNNK